MKKKPDMENEDLEELKANYLTWVKKHFNTENVKYGEDIMPGWYLNKMNMKTVFGVSETRISDRIDLGDPGAPISLNEEQKGLVKKRSKFDVVAVCGGPGYGLHQSKLFFNKHFFPLVVGPAPGFFGMKEEGKIIQVSEDAEVSFIDPGVYENLNTRSPLTPRLIIDGRVVGPKSKHKILHVKISNKSFARPFVYKMEIPFIFSKEQTESLASYIKQLNDVGVPFKFNLKNE